MGVDASTVFRALQRVERGLGRTLFERTRAGYGATELATHAEQLAHPESRHLRRVGAVYAHLGDVLRMP